MSHRPDELSVSVQVERLESRADACNCDVPELSHKIQVDKEVERLKDHADGDGNRHRHQQLCYGSLGQIFHASLPEPSKKLVPDRDCGSNWAVRRVEKSHLAASESDHATNRRFAFAINAPPFGKAHIIPAPQ